MEVIGTFGSYKWGCEHWWGYPRNIFIFPILPLKMVTGVIIFIIAVLAIAIWVMFGFKSMKHKFFAIFLIALILFSFLSFNFVFKGKDISINNVSDLGNIVKIYFSWLGGVFNNIKIITSQVIKMNWKGNSTT